MEINLFQIKPELTQLSKKTFSSEKELQGLFEKNLKALLGVTLLASEYRIDKGRIDTLGIDENKSPVVIEYKLTGDGNVIVQGFSYLKWITEHKGDFEIMVRDKINKDTANEIEWNSPRLICVASEFTTKEQDAAHQINDNIELVRYCKLDDNFLLLELLNKISKKPSSTTAPPPTNDTVSRKRITVSESLQSSTEELKNLYKEVKKFIMNLGDDINEEVLQYYFAFRRIRNFVCAEISHRSNKVILYLKINPDELQLEEGFTRDVRKIGHQGTGDLEITLQSSGDLERAKELIRKSYEDS